MSSNDSLRLKIEFAEDNSIDISINKNSTIQNLKLAIKNDLNINCDEQVLINKGEILKNDKLIKDYNITNNNRIILIIEEKDPNLKDDNDDDYESENQIIPFNQDEEAPENIYLKNNYGIDPNFIYSFGSSEVGKKMMINMLSDPEACYDLFHNPIMKKIFGNEAFLKYDYNTFKNFIDNKEMKMMMRQLSESKPQNSNKKNKKKNFSD